MQDAARSHLRCHTMTAAPALTDPGLIQNLKEHIDRQHDECIFLVEGQASAALEHLWALTDSGDPDCLNDLPQKHARELWTQLVTGAINVLKWQDRRENPRGVQVGYIEWLDETLGHVAFGVDDLDRYFQEFIDFEQVLYGTERYYRDHFVHVIRVWLIGIMVFCRHLPLRQFRYDAPTARFDLTGSEQLAAWTLTALCHDLGYPLQKIANMNVPLRRMISAVGKAQVQDFGYQLPRQHEFIDDFIVRFISSKAISIPDPHARSRKRPRPTFKTEIQPKYYLKFSKSFEDLQHGILSCTLLMKQLVYFLESDFDISQEKTLDTEDARQFLIRRQIIRTIAAHTCDEIYHIHAETFSFLLIICDELQEWGRPTFREMRGQHALQSQAFLSAYGAEHVEIRTKFEPEACNGKPVADAKDFADAVEHRARVLFRRLHKILRSALDVPQRKLRLTWTMSMRHGQQSLEMQFRIDRNRCQVLVGGEERDWLYRDEALLAKWLGESRSRTTSHDT